MPKKQKAAETPASRATTDARSVGLDPARGKKGRAAPRPKRPAGTNWARVDAFSDADIERMAKADPDNPATTVDDWADAVVGLPPAKTAVNARFDADVVDWFKSQGRGYQTRMNAVLRRYMDAQKKRAG